VKLFVRKRTVQKDLYIFRFFQIVHLYWMIFLPFWILQSRKTRHSKLTLHCSRFSLSSCHYRDPLQVRYAIQLFTLIRIKFKSLFCFSIKFL
jgi:hypothetical protein